MSSQAASRNRLPERRRQRGCDDHRGPLGRYFRQPRRCRVSSPNSFDEHEVTITQRLSREDWEYLVIVFRSCLPREIQ